MQSAVRHRTFQLIKAQKKNITCSSSRLLSTYIKIDHQVSAQTHLSSISPHGSRLHLLSKELSPTVVHEKPGPGVVREVISRNDQKGKGDPGGRFKSSKAQLWGVPELPTETSAAGGELELSNKKFAIVEMGGTQHKVVPGDVIVSEKLRVTGTKSWDKIGSIIDLTKEVSGARSAERGARSGWDTRHILKTNPLVLRFCWLEARAKHPWGCPLWEAGRTEWVEGTGLRSGLRRSPATRL